MKDRWIKRLNHYEIKRIEFGERLVKDEDLRRLRKLWEISNDNGELQAQ